MSALRKAVGHRGVQAAAATVVAGGVLASVGIAGAAEQADVTVQAVGEADGNWDQQAVTVQTGDTVTWSFAGTRTHNVASADANEKDPRWAPFAYKGEFMLVQDDSSVDYTFYKSGTYTFQCQFHAQMTGTVTVEGEDKEIPSGTPSPSPSPSPSPTSTATPRPTVSPQPTATPDDHTRTPPPGDGANADTTTPVISAVKLRGLKRAARVRFRLSESATVTLQFRKRGSKRVLRSARLQAAAGSHSVTVRSRKLRKGRYTVTLAARDAMGNRSAARRAQLRIRR